ncbi:MAG TPA: hypothetical protein VI408_01375 [Gaiellaceae bacterium]
MTSHVARLYGLMVAILVFFVAWAAVVAHPWSTRAAVKTDPRIAALVARQHRIHRESVRVQRIVDARWAAYRRALAKRSAAAAAAQMTAARVTPSVRVVTLPALTVTRVS